MAKRGKLHVETRLIHAAHRPDPETGATVAPIVQSTAFAYETAEALEDIFAGRAAGHVYSRISNPTVLSLERRVAALEAGAGAVACSSGMAAISAVAFALAQAGDHIVAGGSIFGGTYSLFAHTLSRCGIRTDFVDPGNLAEVAAAVTDGTRFIFVETIGNPRLDVADIRALAGLAAARGIPLVVDSTVTTPYLVRPGELGANVVVHSASKFLNGHGTAVAGLAIDCGNFDWGAAPGLAAYHPRAGSFSLLAAWRNQFCRDYGWCLAPFSAFLVASGLESLAVRMDRHCANALALARTLAEHPQVMEVRYPGLETHPQHQLAASQFNGKYGAILTLRLGTRERAFRFINGLRHVSNLANLGDARTLAIHPASTFCREATEDQRRAMGVTDDLVRLAVGLEHSEDLNDDILRSLDKL